MKPPVSNPLVTNVAYCYELGWSFVPLSGKVPTQKGWQAAPRESLEDALAWARRGNVGLRTGRTSGVVVLDLDEYKPKFDPQVIEALGLPETVTAISGRGGRQLYFRWDKPLGNSAGRLGPAIDVKADGGQVVFPGSIHPDNGKPYTWADGLTPWDIELAELPASVVEKLTTSPRPQPKPIQDHREPEAENASNGRAERYARMALRLELNAMYQAAEGERNDTLNKAAFSLGQFVGAGLLVRSEVENQLDQAAREIGLAAGEIGATIRSGVESGMLEPRVVPDRPISTGDGRREIDRGDIPALTPGRFDLNVYGNADRFEHMFGQDVHWCEQSGRWYVWDGRVWSPDAMREIGHLAELTMLALAREARGDEDAAKWSARCSRGVAAAREMLEVVKHRTAIALDALDRDQWLLGAQNGVIDLRTGRLMPHNREFMLTTLSPTIFDADAPCPLWERFLSEIMDGDEAMVAALQRLAGYFLTGDISVQILPIFYGPGGNGKNVFLDTLMGLMGPLAAEAPEGLVTARRSDEHPTEIADLHGKRLVVASETEEGRKMRIGLVKKLTGNKYLKGRFMRQDYFQFERTHKTILVTNNKPLVTETSNAIWRRLRLIPFVVTIPEARQDRRLTEKLVAEWPGILSWAVRGCLDWRARQCDLELPAAVQEATEEYRDESDHVADFVTECCEDWRAHPKQNMKTPKERIYSVYCVWCKDIGEDVLTRKAFNSRVRGHGYSDKAAWLHGRTQKCWLHLTLKGKSDE
jgi:putative DNA primase/helicase